MSRRRLSTGLAPIFCSLLVACSGGGSPTDPGFPAPPPGLPDRTATFTPAAPATPDTISLRRAPGRSDLFVLDILAVDVIDISGIRFTLDWPDELLFFDSTAVGPFLSQNGTVDLTVSLGEVSRPTDLPGVSGTGVVLTVAWVYVGNLGEGEIRFTGEAFDRNGVVDPDVLFLGGTIRVDP